MFEPGSEQSKRPLKLYMVYVRHGQGKAKAWGQVAAYDTLDALLVAQNEIDRMQQHGNAPDVVRADMIAPRAAGNRGPVCVSEK